jgi:beta-mannosidase
LDVLIRISINPDNFEGRNEDYEKQISLKHGTNEFHCKIDFKEPQLWWTWDLGNPNLYKIKVEVLNNNQLINEEELKFGMRILEEKADGWYLNGVPIFLRGSCYFSSCWLAEMTSEKFRKDIQLVKEAHMNILRLGYHVEPQDFYDICDHEGILIWQDFPMLWDYDVSRVKELILQFYNHPSIILWCCHCEPMGSNQILLDVPLQETIKKFDTSNRKILLRAHMKDHPFVGWYYSTYYNFLTLPGGENPNEFGAQSVPNASSKFWLDLGRENWWPINNEWMYRDLQKFIMLYLAEILKGHKKGVTLKEFIELSQSYQSKVLKFGIEAFRRGKGKIHGSILFTFNDPWPSITWSIVDYYRNPKSAYYAVKKAYQPIICSVELSTLRLPKIPSIQFILFDLRELLIAPLKALSWNEYHTPNSILTANLWIINDYPYPFLKARLKWELVKGNKIYFTEDFNLSIPPSCSKLVKLIQFKFTKDMAYGEYLIKTRLYDNNGTEISINELPIYLNSSWIKFTKGISRFFGIFKGFLVALLGQEQQLRMFLDSFLKRYEKLAKKSWCFDT